ncbi:Nuclear transcription factor Y subunit A-10 [Striga hermonthica]|uniref:Nuclear transcription factor Y subunit n=1 Tax=Striga hermonthica TaxID=68872 RepID=A0A9N7P1S2_STRHE|nr:Nuclear transcription factor Y subunit A-10 [Striga hermonthica]
MTMQNILFKEHEGLVPNSGNRPPPEMARWVAEQLPVAAYGGHLVQSKLKSLELSASGDATKGCCKGSENNIKIKMQTASIEHQRLLNLQFGYSPVFAQNPELNLTHVAQIQLQGRIMLPLSMASTEGGSIFVNPKQYNRILLRRMSRARALMKNPVLGPHKARRKPYMHFSRHLHAMRRPRGTGGRFLNTKNSSVASQNAATRGKWTGPEGCRGISLKGVLNLTNVTGPGPNDSGPNHLSGFEHFQFDHIHRAFVQQPSREMANLGFGISVESCFKI